MTITLKKATSDKRLRALLHTYLLQHKQDENYNFLYDKSDNQKLYKTYIKVGSPQEINIESSVRRGLNELAAAKKWDDMDDLMKAARVSVTNMLNRDVMPRFSSSPEYKGYLLTKNDRRAEHFIRVLNPPSTKLGTVLGLLKVYNDARSEVDKYQAYEALVKQAGGEARLKAAFVKAKVPLPPPLKSGNPKAAAARFMALAGEEESKKFPNLASTVLALLTKYNTAKLRSARAAALEDLGQLAIKHTKNGPEAIKSVLRQGGWL